MPEALKDRINGEELAKADDFKKFLGDLHAAGASQKVVDAAVATMLERGLAMREALPMQQAADCEATLRQVDGWKSDQEYLGQVRTAFSAGQQIFGEAFKAMEAKGYWNDPDFIKGLATIGREMQEDRGPSPEALQQISSSLDQAMADPAYTNPNHPQHAAAVAKVTSLTAQVAGNRPVASGKTMTFKSA